MTPAEILDLYRYTEWANDRIVTPLLSLSREDFTRHLGGSYPTLRDAYAHVVGAEWLWLERWTGTSPTSAPSWLSVDDPALLTQQLREVEARRARYLSGLSDRDLATECSFFYLSGKSATHTLRDLLIHVANHSTFHRGQIVTMLRQVGTPAQPTDFIVFCAEANR